MMKINLFLSNVYVIYTNFKFFTFFIFDQVTSFKVTQSHRIKT